MTIYNVSSTDRQRVRRIEAETPSQAMCKFLGQRCATCRLNSWTADNREAFFDISVKVGKGSFRMNRDAVKSISGHVWL